MKSAEQIRAMFYATLAELQNGVENESIYDGLCAKLSVLYDILGEDIPEEYWEQVEEFV